MSAPAAERLADLLVPPWIRGESHARMVHRGYPIRAFVGIVALALTPTLPEPRRALFAALVGLVYLPHATALLLAAKKSDGPLVRLASVAGDLAIVFMFIALIPRVWVVGMFGYFLLVAHYTHLGGRAAGLLVAASGFGLTWLGLSIAGLRIDAFTLAMYAVVLTVLVLLFDIAGAAQRAAAARLRELDRIRSELIASLSHEIRTPLTSIDGFALTLRRNWDRLSERERREFVEVIADEADHLRGLLDDLLDFSTDGRRVDLTTTVPQLRPRSDGVRHGPGSSAASSGMK